MLQVGERVTILDKLSNDGINDVVPDMLEHGGSEAIITAPLPNDFYRINVDYERYCWHRTLFIPNNHFTIGERVRVVQFRINSINVANEPMLRYRGGVFTIYGIMADNFYILNEDTDEWHWHASILDRVDTKSAFKRNPLLPKHFIPRPGTRFAR